MKETSPSGLESSGKSHSLFYSKIPVACVPGALNETVDKFSKLKCDFFVNKNYRFGESFFKKSV